MNTDPRRDKLAPNAPKAYLCRCLRCNEHFIGHKRDACCALCEVAVRAVQGQAAESYRQANPLGGPAKVFDAIADAIRAGDPVDQAMREFGVCWQEAPEARMLTEQEAPDYELHCNDEWVAGASGPGALREILHYASQYAKDGPLTLYAVNRREVSIDAAMSGAKAGDKEGKVG